MHNFRNLITLWTCFVGLSEALKFIDYAGFVKYGAIKNQYLVKTDLSASTIASANNNDEIATVESVRLNKARLRLAEAQGIIPIGASESMLGISLKEIKSLPSTSKVREISWRVAEPAVKYDPIGASSKLFSQPLRWLARNVQIFVPVALFAVTVICDIALNKEEENRQKRADALLDIISAQSPALIKAGQALASRSDLLPKEYLDSLQKLQDRCPPYPTEQAVEVFETELGLYFSDTFEMESMKPVAAASIGQVYKGILKKNGAKVAIKIQRPNCEEAIAVDLFVMRWYAEQFQKVLQLLKRDIDLVSVIDDFGEIIYREIDYRAEAVNAQRFAELYANIPDVFVPKIYTELSTSKVLVMEWVDGARLNDEKSIESMGFESSKFIDILVQCSLRQMLENGFFHADPHAGNLLAMSSGKLCYLDFGMVSYVEPSQRYSIIEAVVHMVNRDFVALADLYIRMGFIPKDVDPAPIVEALENALPDVLNSPVGELNFKNVISKLGDVMYKFPFSLPPFYIAIIRCLGVLEGLSIQVDKDFRIINDAYPYIASRLLTDSSEELQSALQKLVFKDGNLRWERLEELLEKASDTNDYDITQVVDQMIAYLISDQAVNVRELLVFQMVDVLDQLETEGTQLFFKFVTSGEMVSTISNIAGNNNINSDADESIIDRFADSVLRSIQKSAAPSSSLLSLGKVAKFLRKNKEFDRSNILSLARKIFKEPVLQRVLSRVISELTERFSVKVVRRIFGQPLPKSTGSNANSPLVSKAIN
eukprot:gene9323-12561_t